MGLSLGQNVTNLWPFPMIADQAYYYHAEPAASRMGGVRPLVGLGLFENLGEIRQNKSL